MGDQADTILVAIGANLPDANGRPAIETCRWAVERLRHLPGLRLDAVSRWFRTAPVPLSDQPDYVNGVARLTGAADPAELLAALHGIEAEAGRVRGAVDAARTLDLDLIAVGRCMLQGPPVTLPHPRMQDRAFVLAPLCDVAPDWLHPRLGLTAAMMLAGADLSGMRAVTA